VLPQLTHLKQDPFGTISMPQVEHEGASPVGSPLLLDWIALRFATFTPGELTAGRIMSSPLDAALGFRYSDERNLPPSQRAMKSRTELV
jgi:hypothetical protein